MVCYCHAHCRCGLTGASVDRLGQVENQEGLSNFDDILNEADGVMVARGDLGMEARPKS